jgi:PAS domain S-box-containing protein
MDPDPSPLAGLFQPRIASLPDDVAANVLDDLILLAIQVAGTPLAAVVTTQPGSDELKLLAHSAADGLPQRLAPLPIDRRGVTVVPDTALDPRLARHPLADRTPPIRFLAAVPIDVDGADRETTLLLLDDRPRTLTDEQAQALQILASGLARHAGLQRQARLLAGSERRLRAIFDNEPECVKLLDPDGRVLDVNPAGQRMVEAEDRREIVGRSLFDLVLPAYHAALRRVCERALAGRTGTVQLEMTTLKGIRRWVEIHAAPLPDEHGEVRAVLDISRDITEQRRAERHIRHLNRMYALISRINHTLVRQKLPEQVMDDACRIAVEEGQFQMAWIGLLAGDKRQTISAHAGADEVTLALMHKLIEVPGNDTGCAFTAEALRTGRTSVCNDIATDPRAASWRAEALARDYGAMASLPLLVHDRVIGTFNLYAQEPGFFDRHELRLLDELAANIGFALEVHDQEVERERVEAALHESENRLRELAETVQEVFYMTDPQSRRLLYVSPGYAELWGRSVDSLYARPLSWMEGIHPDDREGLDHAVANRVSVGDYDETYRIVHPDGTVRWIHDRAYVVRDEHGRALRIVGTAADVTDRHQLEEQLRQSQKMEAIGQLAGGVAHDFNNILTVIHGYGSLLLAAHPAPDDDHEAAQEIVRACEKAANLTRQLLAFSRRQVMQPRRVNLNDVVTSLARMMHRVLGEDVVLQLTLKPRPLITRADPGMIDQILMNLMVNAREAMPAGGRLTIETGEREIAAHGTTESGDMPPGRYVSVTVSDTGQGIPAADLPRIFEPFFTTKEPGKGTGLGLATVFGIVKQHAGNIEVRSTPGNGAVFEILLPALADGAAAEEERVAPVPRGGSETILAVEDEPGLRRLTRLLLERQGYRVLDAANGLEALRLWAEHRGKVDLLLTDIVMPEGLSGRELALQLQKERPNLRVIFTSGYSADTAGRELSLQEGRNFLQKPFSRPQLLEIVRDVLDRTNPPA